MDHQPILYEGTHQVSYDALGISNKIQLKILEQLDRIADQLSQPSAPVAIAPAEPPHVTVEPPHVTVEAPQVTVNASVNQDQIDELQLQLDAETKFKLELEDELQHWKDRYAEAGSQLDSADLNNESLQRQLTEECSKSAELQEKVAELEEKLRQIDQLLGPEL